MCYLHCIFRDFKAKHVYSKCFFIASLGISNKNSTDLNVVGAFNVSTDLNVVGAFNVSTDLNVVGAFNQRI